MVPFLLMVILSVFVFRCIIYMVKRGDDFHAFSFLVLYVYTIFAQVGYVFFPELSMNLNAYYGEEMFYNYWLFIFLSFVSCFVIYKYFPINSQFPLYATAPARFNKKKLFTVFSFLLFLGLNWYFYSYKSLFGWGGAKPMGSSAFVICFKLFTICTFIIYALMRTKFSKGKLLLFTLFLLFFLQVTFSSGSRNYILNFFIAIFFYELSPFILAIKEKRMLIFKMVLVSFFLFQALFALLHLRQYSNNLSLSDIVETSIEIEDMPLHQKILRQDYYAPSHTLFISMYKDYVEPSEVIKSNLCNSLPGIHYPYLTERIVGFVKDDIRRGVGWAFHSFVEGFNFMGYWGFLYNGVMWNLLIGMWLLLIRTNNPFFRKTLLALLAYHIIGGVRSQSSAYVMIMILSLIPAVILLSYATNTRLLFLKKR